MLILAPCATAATAVFDFRLPEMRNAPRGERHERCERQQRGYHVNA